MQRDADFHRSLPELSLAYNGGKDCLVLLILYLCALHKRGLTSSTPSSNIETAVQCVYIQDKHPFKEVEEFVATSIKIYSLSLLEYAKPMKEAFTDYLRDTPSVKAILVGTRRTDPHGEHLKHFDPTDNSWPAFVRVHPVIDWHYVDIWTVSVFFLSHTVRYTTVDTHRWEEPQIPIPIRSSHGKPRQTKSRKSASLTVPRNRDLDQHTSL
jgi:3'-phosphoadenosine 5'-phosphosulfate sulfotransferase (PAPS reductase)/FAD synthetase